MIAQKLARHQTKGFECPELFSGHGAKLFSSWLIKGLKSCWMIIMTVTVMTKRFYNIVFGLKMYKAP